MNIYQTFILGVVLLVGNIDSYRVVRDVEESEGSGSPIMEEELVDETLTVENMLEEEENVKELVLKDTSDIAIVIEEEMEMNQSEDDPDLELSDNEILSDDFKEERCHKCLRNVWRDNHLDICDECVERGVVDLGLPKKEDDERCNKCQRNGFRSRHEVLCEEKCNLVSEPLKESHVKNIEEDEVKIVALNVDQLMEDHLSDKKNVEVVETNKSKKGKKKNQKKNMTEKKEENKNKKHKNKNKNSQHNKMHKHEKNENKHKTQKKQKQEEMKTNEEKLKKNDKKKKNKDRKKNNSSRKKNKTKKVVVENELPEELVDVAEVTPDTPKDKIDIQEEVELGPLESLIKYLIVQNTPGLTDVAGK